MTFGEKVKQLRLVQNLSQSELAEKTGISARSLYTYEQTGTMPRSGNIRKMADALQDVYKRQVCRHQFSVGVCNETARTDEIKNFPAMRLAVPQRQRHGGHARRKAAQKSQDVYKRQSTASK